MTSIPGKLHYAALVACYCLWMCQITMTLRFKSAFPLILSAVKSLAMITGFLVSFVALIICLTHFEVQLSEYNLFLKKKKPLILMHLFRSIKLPYYMIFFCFWLYKCFMFQFCLFQMTWLAFMLNPTLRLLCICNLYSILFCLLLWDKVSSYPGQSH